MVKSVMVDCVRYKVEPTDEILIVDGHECSACVNYDGGIIRIRGSDFVGEGVEAKVLMHEIVHAMLFERARREEAENEELVDAIAAGFVNLVRQNPELIKFIAENKGGK